MLVCDVFAHSTYVFQAATCIQRKPLFCRLCKCWCFFEQVCFTKMAINRAFLQLWPWKRCKLKPATSSFYCIFFHFNWIPGSEVMMFFQNTHHCNSRENTVFNNFWGFVSKYVRTITNVCVFIKSWFLSWSSLRTPVFLKLDRCTFTTVM